jgi:outer membrane protein
MLKRNKKIIASLAAVLLLGVISMTVQSGKVYAAAAVSSAVGVVDYDLLLKQNPDTQKDSEAYKTEVEQAKNEFAAQSGSLSDQEKQELNTQLMQRVEQKRQELLKGIMDKIDTAVKAVAEAKKLSVVVYKNAVAYGGQDITDDVMKKITGK